MTWNDFSSYDSMWVRWGRIYFLVEDHRTSEWACSCHLDETHFVIVCQCHTCLFQKRSMWKGILDNWDKGTNDVAKGWYKVKTTMLWLHYEVLCSSNPTIGVAMAKVHVIWLHPSTFAIHYTSFKSALNRNKMQHSPITTIIRAFSSAIIVSPSHNTCVYFSTNFDLILT
jgi:hypothetical protein